VSSPTIVRQALDILRAKYPADHPEITEQTLTVWHGALARFPDATVVQAAIDWLTFHFPDLNAFVAHTRDVARRMAEADAEARRRSDGEDTVACPECRDGAGWVDDAGRQRDSYEVPVRPCSTCNFRAFWLWNNGHYGRNHDCDLCRRRRKNANALDEAIAADRTPVASEHGASSAW
jgi:hypothetical protein